MHPAFRIYEEATPELIQFLEGTILGTNGARYQHLNTAQRIKELDNPLHLSLIRNEKIIANITFCRRGKNWYIRYFAFNSLFQSTRKKGKTNRNSQLRAELKQFFRNKLESGEVDCFYAYIDPKNDRSFNFANELGFAKISTFYTQTFSRLSPKSSKSVTVLKFDDPILEEKIKHFETESFFHNVKKFDQFYGLISEDNKLVGIAAINRLNWKIFRLPGRFGKILTKIIPFIPFIKKLVVSNNHQFIGVDHVWIDKDDPKKYTELLESILALEDKKLAIWWVDSRLKKLDPINWGIGHRFLGVNPVDFYVLNTSQKSIPEPYFLISNDFS